MPKDYKYIRSGHIDAEEAVVESPPAGKHDTAGYSND